MAYLPYIALALLLWSIIGFWRAVAPLSPTKPGEQPKWYPVWVYGPLIWIFAGLWWWINRDHWD